MSIDHARSVGNTQDGKLRSLRHRYFWPNYHQRGAVMLDLLTEPHIDGKSQAI